MTTPKQIDSVVGVDRMDTIDRAKLDPRIKFQLLCAEARVVYGRDPRSGGFAFVARPRALLQLMKDFGVSGFSTTIRLQLAMVLGTSRGRVGETVGDSDVVGWWEGVPIAVRCSVVDDNLWVLPLDKVIESRPIDRQRAGQLRMAAHNGRLHSLED